MVEDNKKNNELIKDVIDVKKDATEIKKAEDRKIIIGKSV